MKIKPCPKTVSGKHDWKTKSLQVIGNSEESIYDWSWCEITPVCRNCGLIDDTKKPKTIS